MSEGTAKSTRPLTKAEEEAKRERVLARDPALRWRIIQDTITWAEANMPEHLRRNRPRTR